MESGKDRTEAKEVVRGTAEENWLWAEDAPVSPDPRQTSLRSAIEILLVVSVRLYRDGITQALQQDGRFSVVGSYGSLDAARKQLHVLPRPPDVALIGVGLAEGTATVRALRATCASTSIVALAVRETDDDVVAWVEAGVSGLVSRETTLAELFDAVEAAANDGVVTTPAVTAALLRRVAALAGQRGSREGAVLTRREREIVRLIADGLSNKEIASALRIELATVKNHVHNILDKLRVRHRTDAIGVARARGELEAM
jgi:two-component system, NarL family, nitrate/nitrite response regulator NarL